MFSVCVVAVEQSVALTSSPPVVSSPLHCASHAYSPPPPTKGDHLVICELSRKVFNDFTQSLQRISGILSRIKS
jgi:hypothetical protein